MKQFNSWLVALGILASLSGCGEMPWEVADGGSGTETTGGAKVIGMVVYPNGSPATGASIVVRPLSYLHANSNNNASSFYVETFVTETGSYQLDSLPSGDYVLEIRDQKGNASLAEFRKEAERRNQTRSTDTLRRSGSLRGSLGHVKGAVNQGFVQIYGLARFTETDSNGNFWFDELPEGHMHLRAVSSLSNWNYADTAVSVLPSDTTQLGPLTPVLGENYATWASAQTIVLNTAAVEVRGDVFDFPLLLRLDTGNFNFQNVQSKELRFSDFTGRHLSYSVEYWDSAAGKASVWVKLDMIKGNRSDQAITMYWGRPGANDSSDSHAVFNSFAGVWHLSDSTTSSTSTFPDRSPTGAHGTGTVLRSKVDGLDGLASAFHGSQFIKVPGVLALKPETGLTLSVWIRITGTDSLGSDIVTMGGNYGLHVNKDGTILFNISTDQPAPDHMWSLTSNGLPVRDSLWHYVVGTFDGTTMRLFLDGAENTAVLPNGKMNYLLEKDLWMGRNGNDSVGYNFFGNLDEVQVSPHARSVDWIRLSFKNQKKPSSLIQFK